MGKVSLYSLLLILGIVTSQVFDLAPFYFPIKFITLALLGYIMIEVGLEFSIDKKNIKGYGKDYLIATSAAALPWILCSLYFFTYFEMNFSSAALIGLFAAPTSAGVLFAMLAAAGLATTWVFKKARILAILDDLDTILLIVPLQMIHLGFEWRSLILIGILAVLLIIAWRFLHHFALPTSRLFLIGYAFLLTTAIEIFQATTLISLEILLPAFVLGCLIKNPHLEGKPTYLIPEKGLDDLLKFGYMFLVGCSLPKISFTTHSFSFIAWNVLIITSLANLGKLVPLFCYKREATLRTRTALSIAMWPRGEVGAGILLISMNYAMPSIVLQLAELSLALNLILTGFFIYLVIRLLKKDALSKSEKTG